MRWKTGQYDFLDTRIKEHFLFLPKRIGNECRWLERAKYKQRYEYISDGSGLSLLEWVDTEWIDEVKNERTIRL